LDIAKKMLQKGIDVKAICECTGLDPELMTELK
jgi:hypothetical protein